MPGIECVSDSVQIHRAATPLAHDPEKWKLVSLATNAKRLRGDHAQTISWGAMTIHPELIAL